MQWIEHRGAVLSGYIPDLPQKHGKAQRKVVSYFNSIGRVEKF